MASASQASVTTSATSIIAAASTSGGGGGRDFLIKSTSSTAVYVGGAGVTTSTGYLLTQNVEYPVQLGASEALYAVAASGTVTVYVLGVN